MRQFSGGGVCLFVQVALAGAAAAADLPVKAPPAIAPPSWTGCYIGAHAGLGWARNRAIDDQAVPGVLASANTATGAVVGGQLGCDYQTGPWVFGLRGRIAWADVSGSNAVTAAALASGIYSANERIGHKTSWLAALDGRIGYAVLQQSLAYVVGGAAWVHNRYTDADLVIVPPYSGQATATRTGWLIGAGFEHRLHRNWSVFAEYNYVALGGRSITLNFVSPPFAPYTYRYRQEQNLQTVVVGVNYRFGGVTP